MMEKNGKILFKLVIHSPDPGQETEYTIFDKTPSFASMSSQEKRYFVKHQQQKIKKLISQKYQPLSHKATF